MPTDINNVSSAGKTDNPYAGTKATAVTTEKNTLSITSYFKLLAAQLANQDMSNPMSTSDMMNQMSQMAMVQSLTALTESTKSATAMSKQSYAAGMIGREVNYNGKSYTNGTDFVAAGVRTGTIESVNFTGENPTFKVAGDPEEYSLDAITGVVQKAAIGKAETTDTQEPKGEGNET
jgi:flagellar basal-body rod modification protein FlgD